MTKKVSENKVYKSDVAQFAAYEKVRDAITINTDFVPDYAYAYASTLENAAFVLAGVGEIKSSEEVLSVMSVLSVTPMFKLIADEYRKGLSGQASGLPPADDDNNDYELRLLCARCFLAGLEAQKLYEKAGYEKEGIDTQ